MPLLRLDNRALIAVTGEDAGHFLQTILTVDLDALPAGELRPGALLSPQGKILFDFLVSRDGGGGFLLDCRAETGDDFVRRLMLYRLRAKVAITKLQQGFATIGWEIESGAASIPGWFRDSRFAELAVVRSYGSSDALPDLDAWTELRVRHGVAESGCDYQLGDAFPHDVLLDQTGGVGFRKGCYVGQEVVSRMQHRGTARRRVLIVEAGAALPATGTEITVGGRPVGTLGSVAGNRGLAVVRIDRVKDAMDAGQTILAGEVAVALGIPAWARFSWPEAATGETA